MMPIAPIRIAEQSEEQEDIADTHAVVLEVRLRGAGLTEGAAAPLKHRIMMAKIGSRQSPLCHALNNVLQSEIAVCRLRSSLRRDRKADRPSINNRRRSPARSAIEPLSAEDNLQGLESPFGRCSSRRSDPKARKTAGSQ
jgi:hypothetical protein